MFNVHFLVFFYRGLIVILLSICILSALILLSGAFSATEIALSSANRTKVKTLAESGHKKAKQLWKAIEDPTAFFATTQLYITFIAFFAGAYAASSFTDPIVTRVLDLGLPISTAVAEPVVFIFVTLILTYFMLVFGELIPKRIALKNSMKFAFSTIGFLNILSKVVFPFVKLLSVSANFILRLFGIKDNAQADGVTKEEIRMMLKSGSEYGNIAESEHDIMNNVLNLEEKTVKDAGIHRVQVTALPVEVDFDEIVKVLIEEKYSRIPIYENSIDNILGFLHMKDIMKYMADNKDVSGFNIRSFLHEPYFVPPSKNTIELLQEMQKNHVYMAIIVDEYGGMTGIVTIEDLVEEIVGSILDEYDADESQEIIPIGQNTFSVQGSIDFEKVQSYFGTEFPVDEYDTLSGFIIGQLQRIPMDDEKPEIEFGGFLFTAEEVHDKRIVTVLVKSLDNIS